MNLFVKKITVLLVVVWAFIVSSCGFTSPEQKPNVVIILTDDQGWGDLSSHGNEILQTPALDSLASRSVSFNRFYVSQVCAPTRASLLTGRYHLRTGTSWVTHGRETMRSEETTLAEILKENNYKTGCFGKWHNGSNYPNDPNGQGFDEFLGFASGHWNNYFNTKLRYNQKMVQTEGYVADILTDSAINFIKKAKNQPFFCYVPYNTPHSPFQVADKYFNKYKRLGCNNKDAAVYGMVENIDYNTNRILKTLDSLKIAENTIVIFLSDNGPNGVRYNGGMKGIKASIHEGGVRVPFYIRFPRKLKCEAHSHKMKNIKQFAAHIDILPTILNLCNIGLPENLKIDGKSLVPLMLGAEENTDDRLFFSHHVIREFDKIPGAVRSQNYLLTLMPNDTAFYNLSTDPNQKHNIITEFPDKAKEYMQAYDKWFAEVTKKGNDALPIPIGYNEAPKVFVEAQNARLFGNTRFKGEMGWANDWITNFAKADTAVWNVDIHSTATYNIALEYACAEEKPNIELMVEIAGKTIKKTLSTAFYTKTIQSTDRVKRSEVYEQTWGVFQIGELLLPKGKNQILLTVLDAKEEQTIEVKSVIVEKL